MLFLVLQIVLLLAYKVFSPVRPDTVSFLMPNPSKGITVLFSDHTKEACYKTL